VLADLQIRSSAEIVPAAFFPQHVIAELGQLCAFEHRTATATVTSIASGRRSRKTGSLSPHTNTQTDKE
jgi:hypothetical protein